MISDIFKCAWPARPRSGAYPTMFFHSSFHQHTMARTSSTTTASRPTKIFGQTVRRDGRGNGRSFGRTAYQRQSGNGGRTSHSRIAPADNDDNDSEAVALSLAMNERNESRRLRQTIDREIDDAFGFTRLPSTVANASSVGGTSASLPTMPITTKLYNSQQHRRGWLFQMQPTTVSPSFLGSKLRASVFQFPFCHASFCLPFSMLQCVRYH
jgi:hypothetical protein